MRILFCPFLSLFMLAAALPTGFAQQPVGAFQSGSVTNLPNAGSLDLSNTSSGDLCANTYVFDQKDGSFVSCCSSLLSPNQAYTMSTRIGSGTTGVAAPNNLTIKLVSTHPFVIGLAKICDPTTPIADNLASGMRVSLNGSSFAQTQLSTCISSTPGQPCRTELDTFGLFCRFLKSTGSGFGQCQAAVPAQSSPSNEQEAAEIWHWTMYFH